MNTYLYILVTLQILNALESFIKIMFFEAPYQSTPRTIQSEMMSVVLNTGFAAWGIYLLK